jgi:type III restriction enzyme
MPAMYSPDFLLRTKSTVYVIETTSQHDLAIENVARKQRSAVAWCEQLNALPADLRGERDWQYVILGEAAVKEWKSKNARVSELLVFARLRRKPAGREGVR